MNQLEWKLKEIVLKLVPDCSKNEMKISKITGGKNNRAYHIALDKRDFFLKQYNTVSKRNRLLSEYHFLKSRFSHACKYTVRPIGYDLESMCAIYEYKSGLKYHAKEVGRYEINHALQFLHDINLDGGFPKLFLAQESCFSIRRHLACVDKRINSLLYMDVSDTISARARSFVVEKLKPCWEKIRKKANERASECNLNIGAVMPQEDRIISPSDFGFHNALKQPDNKIIFFDFEYAGWDDPAKLIGDFFHQVEVPISYSYYDYFVNSVSCLVKNKEAMMQRTNLIFPVIGVKWCCIILNYFLPEKIMNKQFSTNITPLVREKQLEKAKNKLQHVIHGVIND